MQKLCRDADILIEGYRPGVVRKLGADYETIRALNPRIIYCSLSGYGQDGPYSQLSGHDITYVSIAGILGLVGPAEVPLRASQCHSRFCRSLPVRGHSHSPRLYCPGENRRRPIHRSCLPRRCHHLMTRYTHNYFLNGTMLKRGESWVLGSFPFYAAYETKDGKYISIGCLEPHFWKTSAASWAERNL